jgi:hypothetical protein
MIYDKITISGHTFTVPCPYSHGHVCTEAEARILNQVYHSRLRKNFADRVQPNAAGVISNELLAIYQTQLNDYANTFSLEGSSAVDAEALTIALEVIRKSIKDRGNRIGDYTKSTLNEFARGLLSGPQGPAIIQLARRRVSEVDEAAKANIEANAVG